LERAFLAVRAVDIIALVGTVELTGSIGAALYDLAFLMRATIEITGDAVALTGCSGDEVVRVAMAAAPNEFLAFAGFTLIVPARDHGSARACFAGEIAGFRIERLGRG
jgi:hypothetical protein